MSHQTAKSQGLVSCHECYKVSPAGSHLCPRCHAHLHPRKTASVQRTMALLITATLLYIPANIFPIMITSQFTDAEPSTILGGIFILVQMEAYPVASIIFIASVIVPLAKLIALYFLCWYATRGSTANLRQKTQLFRIAEFMGKWSMVDVFVVSILVALVQLQGIMGVEPGIAALSFSGVVIITMIAAESFDTRLMWDRLAAHNNEVFTDTVADNTPL
ncbi:hypothetical protein G8770_05170 [Aestuariicella hydrocarbonica]|uniref:Paraquat-inducible protein A n=1 Tax=Pseudomaricurvus hydrocarbonicus TaxID=1470433 RepID=A0A9E5JU47_9GAMM|nr:paraquat-inducible protein A [Aestuariicella hydrocarbonica]NHO64930.1 hypothetical protein [Aestuariicella hydrocarbonica]